MKKFLALVLALIMTASLVTISAGAEDFSDAEAITYTEAVEVMTAIDVIDGYTDGSFGPAGNLTRGAAAKIICNMILGPTTAGALRADASVYSDVAADHVFAPYIAYLAKEGIVSGYADGTFKPAAPLTGYAFMKMLLGVAGYDPAIEGYTGANWSINVAKQGLALGLLDNYVGTFNGTATVNRETAMLMAFNTIQTYMVEYDNKSTITVGDIVVSTNSEAKKVYEDGIAATDVLYVMENYFPDLDVDSTVTDAFGRPANYWMNDKEEIGLYVWTPDAVYTDSVTVKTIYADLGLADTPDNEDYYVNTDAAIAAPDSLTKKGTAEYGAPGQIIEVYYFKEYPTNVAQDGVSIVEIDVEVGQILQVKEDDVDRVVVLDTMLEFETEEFEEEQWVIYTQALDSATGLWNVQEMAAAQKTEGVELTKYVDKSGTATAEEFVGSGKTYTVSTNYDATESGLNVLGDVLDVYTDENGYVVYAEATASAKKYAYVLDSANDPNLYLTSTDYYAMVVTTDGKVEELKLSKINGDDVADATDAPNNKIIYSAADASFVEYAQLADGTYKLTTVATEAPSALVEIKAGLSAIDAATDYYGNAKTIYIKQSGEVGSYTYTAYTGYANIPGMTGGNVTVALVPGSATIAKLVFIDATADVSGGDSYIYIDGDSVSGKISDANGDYYVYPAIINGEIKSVYVDDVVGADVMLNNVIYNEFGVIDWAKTNILAYQFTTDATKDAYTIADVEVTKKLTDGVIETDAGSFTVADDVKAYVVTDNGSLTNAKADTIAATAVKGILATNGTLADGVTPNPNNVDIIIEDGAISVIILTDVKQNIA